MSLLPITMFEEQAAEAQQAARLVRDLLLQRDAFATPGRSPATAMGRRHRRRRRRPMAELAVDRDLEVLLDYLRRSRGSTSAATSGPA